MKTKVSVTEGKYKAFTEYNHTTQTANMIIKRGEIIITDIYVNLHSLNGIIRIVDKDNTLEIKLLLTALSALKDKLIETNSKKIPAIFTNGAYTVYANKILYTLSEEDL